MNNPNQLLGTTVNGPLNEIPAIEISAGQLIRNASDLEAIVEAPALLACQTLYDKNIRTASASANRKDDSRAYIVIEYASLSDDNKTIGLKYGEPLSAVRHDAETNSDPEAISLDVAIDDSDTPETISAKLQGLAMLFEKQKLLWAPTYSLDDMKKMYGYNPDEQVSVDMFVDEGFYFDQGSNLFYLSEELFQKSRE